MSLDFAEPNQNHLLFLLVVQEGDENSVKLNEKIGGVLPGNIGRGLKEGSQGSFFSNFPIKYFP